MRNNCFELSTHKHKFTWISIIKNPILNTGIQYFKYKSESRPKISPTPHNFLTLNKY